MSEQSNNDPADIAIIGAGAAGLMAAIFAGRNAPPGTKIVLLDGAKKIGAKILIAGGGRCNVTHDVVTTADYFGGTSNNTVKKASPSCWPTIRARPPPGADRISTGASSLRDHE